MPHANELIDDQSRLINSSKPTRSTTGQRPKPEVITPKRIADLFGIMIGLFGGKWIQSHGSSDRTGQWWETLKDLHPNQLQMGVCRVRQEGKEWPPSAPEFRKLCQPLPEELGLPTLAKAWREANEHASQPERHGWSHRAVYLAGRTAGWYELRNAGTAEECREVKRKFGAVYQEFVNRECQGVPLEERLSIEHQFDPATHSNQLQRETMMDQGIDPLDGQGARAKLKGMF